jgi:hypothetical protein
MTPTVSHPPAHRWSAARPRRPARKPPGAARDVLGRYACDRPREIVLCAGAGGSKLVIDRDAATLGDRRLVAHLSPDEPPGNAALVCSLYLAERRRCRRVEPSDLEIVPAAIAPDAAADVSEATLVDAEGGRHRLEIVQAAGMSIPELRWLSLPPDRHLGAARVVSLRDVVGALENYEPARALSAGAVERHRDDPGLSVATLRAELQRVAASRIVLNRGLREAVLETSRRDGLSMSAIAVRCGRVKRDARGNISGETSWLARRLGLLPEGGGRRTTVWVHSEVLALIARRGLGVSPREVELG